MQIACLNVVFNLQNRYNSESSPRNIYCVELLLQGAGKVENIEDDFADGTLLYHLLVALTKDTSPPKIVKQPKMKAQKLDNLNVCFSMIRKAGIKLTNIGGADVHDGNKKLILALLWNLILHFDVCAFTEDGDAAKGRNDLLLWVQNRCEEKGVAVNNFTSDFRDGSALLALVNSVGGGQAASADDG
tara:strand:- start:139 stop:699 length:561 start_codon:yes stop_codon:yes gene_type:complete